MRVLVAFDKFKDAIGAHDACAIATQALHSRHPDWIIESAPLTDGGDGFARILAEATATLEVRTTVTGPRGFDLARDPRAIDGSRRPGPLPLFAAMNSLSK